MNKARGVKKMEFKSAFDTLFKTLEESKAWFVICIRPNDHQLPNQFEARQVKQQVITYAINDLAVGLSNEYTVSMTHDEFCERYSDLAFLNAAEMKGASGGEARQKCNNAKEVMGWSDKQARCGRMKIFLCHKIFRQLEDELRAADPDEVRANERRAMLDADAIARGEIDPLLPADDQANLYSQRKAFSDGTGSAGNAQNPFSNQLRNRIGARPGEDDFDDAKSSVTSLSGFQSSRFDHTSPSIAGTESYAPSRNMFSGQVDEKIAGFSGTDPHETVEVAHVTAARRKWTCITWSLTFWIPSFVLSKLCGLKRLDIRMAWREKLAINMMVWLVCACAIFVITILGNLICPKQHVFSDAEFQAKASKYSMTRIRGEVFNLDNIITMHKTSIPVVQDDIIKKYAGIDATPIFPVQVNALCNGRSGSISPWVQLTNENTSDVNAKYHDFRAIHPEDTRPDWYYESMVLMRSNFRVGFMGYTPEGIQDLIGDGRSVGVYRGDVYDVSDYIRQGYRGAVQAPANMRAPGDTDAAFMSESLISLFNQNPGQDLTKKIDALPLSNAEWHRQRVCLRNLFFIGKKDNRNSPQCRFSQNILLALSVIMVAIIGFKFLAALQFGRARVPEDHDKFVICQVPCYTEGEESMRKTINSLAALKYDDKRKLLFVICDGMIVGSGNDRPTPRIVLDILGADTRLEPEPLSFLSLGEGSKQHNMAKVYSGLYEHHGHVVPYVVVVKRGKPTERHRPGNRGKRDSQLILMRFLNKVHFGLPMNPMELEVFHQIKNVIGVNPSFYEYVLQVDADTEVDPWSLNKFVSAFTNDKKVIGLCGETSISNSKRTFITMLQVYEYFISHYLSKAFESLFGSVTCLPGCFSMFRIRTPDTHRPLFIANDVVEEYAENRVDTLHTKNLLHLGEDRYLTTLVLKHFGEFKTTFVRDAKAKTAVPEDWSVLLSQRRRWINSTIHNLFELLSTPGLCGFCLFSMRFVVFVDLLSTIVAPVTLIYIVYLLFLIIKDHAAVPLTAILMLAAIYGLQAILFLLRRRFDMVVWMLIYIIGLPIWTFFLPLYSFWHMDDFSWGNTRVVMGEKGKKIVTHDEGTFDPSEIPQKTWQQYEEELWERGSNQSIGTILLNRQGGAADEGMTRAESHYTASIYGMPQIDNMMGVSYKGGSGYQSPVPSIYMGASGNVRGNAMESGALSGTPYSPVNQGRIGSSYGPLGGSPAGSSAGVQGLESPFQAAPVASSTAINAASVMHRPRFSTPSSSYFGQVNNPPPYAGGGGPSSGRSTPNASGQPTIRAVNLVDLESPLIDMERGSLPTDEVIARDIRSIISASDLNTITMKGIRAQLEAMYGTSINAKKAFISDTVDSILGDL
jgi:chitin synthase